MSNDHFSTQAAQYAQFRPTYPAELFDWLAGQVSDRGAAWDCACGNGQATRDIAARFQRVIATDLSAAQIAHAPVLPNVEWRAAHAENSGIESVSMDLVTVAQALHWFDLPLFWQETRRVLRPGGVIAVWSYGVFEIEPPEIAAICQHFYEDVVGPYWPPERRIVEAGYGSLDFPFDEIPVPRFQMKVEWSLEALLGYLSSWSATTRYTQATGEEPIPALAGRLRALWPATNRLHIRWPLSLRAGRTSDKSMP